MNYYKPQEVFGLNNVTVTVGTVTYAIKLKKLLSRAGIRSRLVKAEGTTAGEGCTHGVEISSSDFLFAVVIMKENGIPYSVK